MPSLTARLISTLLRTTGVVRRRFSDGPGFEGRIAESREKQPFPTAKMRARLECDLEYLRHWSLALDLRIIARTVGLVFLDRKAY